MKSIVTVATLTTLLCGSAFARTPAPHRRPAWRSPERRTVLSRWFDGYDRHGSNQGQYQKRKGRRTGPEGREEISGAIS